MMSDSKPVTPDPDVTHQPDLTDAGCQKRLHADGGSEQNGSADAPAVSAAEQQPLHQNDAAAEPQHEPEPPQKRVKVDPESELDIRFLICSKVSHFLCQLTRV